MSMSILHTPEETRARQNLPALSTRRLVLVLVLSCAVFLATVAGMRLLMPGARSRVEYLLMATVGIAAALVTVLLSLFRNRQKMFIPPDDSSAA